MQQHNDPTVQRLREIEKNSVPDLSQLDQHWKDMQITIATTPDSSILHRYRWFFLSATAGLAGLMAFLLSVQPRTHLPSAAMPLRLSGDTVPIRTVASQATKTSIVTTDSIPLPTPVQSTSANAGSVVPAISPVTAMIRTRDTLFLAIKNNQVIKRDTLLLKAITSEGRDTVLTAVSIEQSGLMVEKPIIRLVPSQRMNIQTAGPDQAGIDTVPIKVRVKPIQKTPDTFVLRPITTVLPAKSQ